MYFNQLTPKNDQHLTSPYCNTGQSSINHKVVRKKGNEKGFDRVKQILLINTIRNGWITVCGEYTVYPIQVFTWSKGLTDSNLGFKSKQVVSAP